MCTQYAVEIYKNYGVVQHEKRAVWGYMKNLQSDLTPKMRAMLVDWMVQGSVKLTKKNVATPDNKFTADTRIGTAATILSLLKAWLANVYLIC
ncbi:Cyclin-A2-2 [Carex littledalei]|uniref:Cyclin-A2-2 n=1 Tax=Carex littledalei TaxID=544730 RepID=A0A833QNG7_9POAL|nr:Cyclin-A2-2 [Carex littledalei]